MQIIAVTRFGARLNRLPAAAAGDMVRLESVVVTSLGALTLASTAGHGHRQEGKAGSPQEG